MIDIFLMYSYSYIWDDIHKDSNLYFCIQNRINSLEWLSFIKEKRNTLNVYVVNVIAKFILIIKNIFSKI